MAEPKRIPKKKPGSGRAANDSNRTAPATNRNGFSVVGGKSTKPAPANKSKQTPDVTPAKRITTANRSYLNQPFFDSTSANRAGRVTVDEKFASGYSKRGLRPSYESVDPRIKNVRLREKYAEGELVGEAGGAVVATTGEPTRTQRAAPPKSRGFVERQYTRSKVITQQKLKGKTSAADRKKASLVNTGIMIWLVPSYFVIQLPFAIISLVALGMAYVVTSITTSDDDVFNEDTGVFDTVVSFLWEGVKFVGNTINEAVEFVTGVDFLAFIGNIPLQIAGGFMMLLLAYGMIVLLVMNMMYMGAGMRPLSGKNETSKIVLFILCLIGYFAPLFNLFPWAVFWGAVMWRYPK